MFSIETSNQIVKELDLDVQIIERNNGIGVIARNSNNIVEFDSVMDYLKGNCTGPADKLTFTVGKNVVKTEKFYIVAVMRDMVGWCDGINNHLGCCDRRHISKITFTGSTFGVHSTIENNGSQCPYSYIIKGLICTPKQWQELEIYPPYVPKNTQFPADITLPTGTVVHCETIYHVPRMSIPIEWFASNKFVTPTNPHVAGVIKEYIIYVENMKKWDLAMRKLADGYIDVGYGDVRFRHVDRPVLSELILISKPQWRRDTHIDCHEFA